MLFFRNIRSCVKQVSPQGLWQVNVTLVDTSCIVALLDSSEKKHARCAEVVTELHGPLIACEAVIAESCYLLRNIRGAPEAVLENVANGLFQLPFDLGQSCSRVKALMKKYRNIPMDLADACLVSLAEDFESGRILTLDTDFRIYRWGKNRAFEMLLI